MNISPKYVIIFHFFKYIVNGKAIMILIVLFSIAFFSKNLINCNKYANKNVTDY